MCYPTLPAPSTENYKLYRTFYAEVLPPQKLLQRFKGVYRNVSDAEIQTRVAAWEKWWEDALGDDGPNMGTPAGRISHAVQMGAAVGARGEVEWIGDLAEGPQAGEAQL